MKKHHLLQLTMKKNFTIVLQLLNMATFLILLKTQNLRFGEVCKVSCKFGWYATLLFTKQDEEEKKWKEYCLILVNMLNFT